MQPYSAASYHNFSAADEHGQPLIVMAITQPSDELFGRIVRDAATYFSKKVDARAVDIKAISPVQALDLQSRAIPVYMVDLNMKTAIRLQ